MKIEELRNQFEDYCIEDDLHHYDLERNIRQGSVFYGLYKDKDVQKLWFTWQQCSRLNKIIK